MFVFACYDSHVIISSCRLSVDVIIQGMFWLPVCSRSGIFDIYRNHPTLLKLKFIFCLILRSGVYPEYPILIHFSFLMKSNASLFKVGYFRHVSILPDLVVMAIDCCLILRSGNFDMYQIHPTLIHIPLFWSRVFLTSIKFTRTWWLFWSRVFLSFIDITRPWI